MELLDKLNWRYATKAMSGKKVAQDKIDRVIEAARLAPTSSGLQPFEIFVITNQEVKDKIKPVAWNQPVISDCSHLLVFAAWDTYTADRINRMFDLTNEIRGFENQGWEDYRQMLLASYPQKDPEENFHHAAKQALPPGSPSHHPGSPTCQRTRAELFHWNQQNKAPVQPQTPLPYLPDQQAK